MISGICGCTTEVQGDTSGVSNKLHAWGFKRNPNAAPNILEEERDLLARNGGIYIGNEQEKRLYLTFDNGYEKGYTPKILDTLREHNVTATFFITGHYLDANEDLVRRIVDEKHHIGNHTIHHVVMPNESDEKNRKELDDLKMKFREKFGENAEMKYMRPPKGEYSERTLKLTKELGYTTVFWSSAYVDWDESKAGDRDNAFKMITSQFHNGSIILLHNTSQNNADVLGDVIKAAREAGFEFGNLDEIAQL
jgi:peptidoglycan-N-acetylmuramic acid deacetylase